MPAVFIPIIYQVQVKMVHIALLWWNIVNVLHAQDSSPMCVYNNVYVCVYVCITVMSMAQWSNLKGFSSQTYFFHSTDHYHECVASYDSVPPDPTMTVDNVTQVLSKIPGHKWERVMGGLGIPGPLLEEIQRRYSTDMEKNHACADYYVSCHPLAEWEHLTTRGLYWRKEFAAARESMTFMSTGKYCTISYSYAQVEYHSLKFCWPTNEIAHS